jgi:hypothetical protein
VTTLAIIKNQAEITELQNNLDQIAKRMKELEKETAVQEQDLDQVTQALANFGGLDHIEFRSFMKKPYITLPKGKKEVLLIVPKFVNFHAGWLIKETETYNVFRFDRYSAWLGDAPAELLQEIDFKKEFDAVLNGLTLTFPEQDKAAVRSRLRDHIKDVRDTTATVIQGHVFQVITEMIESGCLPFTSRPVQKEDLRDPRADITLRGYQQATYDKFMQTGAVGIFHPTGAGKSIVAMKIADVIKGPKLIIVPTTTLRDQWEDYIKEYLPHIQDEITVATYMTGKPHQREWVLVIYDECQHLPANTFSGLSLLKTKYRLGLSASPYREDGRESYIIALTGFPMGVNWSEYMQVTGKNYHPITVHVIKGDWPDKFRLLDTLVDRSKKTLIFSDNIDIGSRIAKRLKIPFIYGETANRLEIIKQNRMIAISRVGDLGVSIKDLDHVIEVDFLFGSRQQELQRTGRLMHSQSKEPKHDIIMTRNEMEKYGKRLYALQEKGFKVQLREVK